VLFAKRPNNRRRAWLKRLPLMQVITGGKPARDANFLAAEETRALYVVRSLTILFFKIHPCCFDDGPLFAQSRANIVDCGRHAISATMHGDERPAGNSESSERIVLLNSDSAPLVCPPGFFKVSPIPNRLPL
jgi:hypothetical protein